MTTHSIGVFASLFDDDGRIVLVRQTYRGQCWAQPGGRLEPGEAPLDGVLREIFEETGYRAEVTGFIGASASPWRDDLVLHFRARILRREAWTPDDEIADCALFPPDALPSPMRTTSRARIADAVAGRNNVFRTHASLDSYSDL
ncbi:MAG TPA: NUDIX domain-containing protein [Caulobacteraceae bacterium]|jgi:8-oxo-dGTP pyrophosphatase MutT (NUDIX family)